MPIDFQFEMKKTAKSIRLKKWSLGAGEWISWWYRGVLKNRRAIDQPHVRVVFRKLVDGKLTMELQEENILVTALDAVRLGRVWNNGRCLAEAAFEEKIFDINFSKEGWRYTSFRETNLNLRNSPFPQQLYPLGHPNSPTKLIDFSTAYGGNLVIPCMVYFACCYGASAEIRRVLTTFSEGECLKRFFAPLGRPKEDGKWQIRRKRRGLKMDDSRYLAHYKYDEYTRNVSKGIYSQIEAFHDPDNDEPTEIQIPPWFEGEVKVKVSGIPYDKGRSFLALQVLGCSDPVGLPISCYVEKKNKTGGQENVEEGERIVSLETITSPDEIDLTDDDNPNQGGSIADVSDSSFQVIGPPRIVVNEEEEVDKESDRPTFDDVESTSFSTGDPYGSGGEVGYALLHITHELESKGILRDIWDVLIHMKESYPDRVHKVECFTFDDGFCDDEPKLISMEPFDEDDEVDNEVRNWLFLDRAKKLNPRGILVIRSIIDGKNIYLIEIQRRWGKKKKKDGSEKEGEESLTGLIFTLRNQSSLESWLRRLFLEIRMVKGVFSKVAGLCPGEASSFKHPPSNEHRSSGEASVRNALSKVDITL